MEKGRFSEKDWKAYAAFVPALSVKAPKISVSVPQLVPNG
jgi:hypothetical protein